MNDRSTHFKNAKRVVVKAGSGLLTEAHGLNLKVISALSRQICRLGAEGRQVILVSSGAMASGVKRIGLKRRPDEVPKRQAVAAVGQAGLIREYEKAFKAYDKNVAQILLTSDDVTNRKRYLNARNTINTLLEWQVLPIVNENDTVRVEEIQLGDNDNLAALISLLMDADILINLTDIDGLYDKDPRRYKDARLLPEIETIGPEIEQMAGSIPGPLGAGGMLSKIKAARKVTSAGIPMVVANGRTPDILPKLFGGHTPGTFFVPKTVRLTSRKRWIAYNLKPEGTLTLDAGAARALIQNGRSLLPSGIIQVAGHFRIGAAVTFQNSERKALGVGLVNYCADDIRKIRGLKTDQIADVLGYKPYNVVIHRDNMAITPGRDDG